MVAIDAGLTMKTVSCHSSSLDYLTVYPDNYVEGNSYPLIICLHGFGANMHDLSDLAPVLSSSGGDGYSLTPFGEQWLREAGGKYDYVPTEPGRFAQMLDTFSHRFGQGYKERGQEAMRCYGAHANLACCAMCGAAAESIVLALAIEKIKDRVAVEKEYFSTGGRGRIEKRLLGSVTKQIADQFRSYMDLLKYWRDNAAHGLASNIDDNEANTSLMLLLRFAQFANDRWSELTA